MNDGPERVGPEPARSASSGPPGGGSAFRRFLGTACGPGYLPMAPGTWGSFATVVVVALLVGVEGRFEGIGLPPALNSPEFFGLTALVILLGGVALGHKAQLDWGRHDPGSFVVDEVVGQLLPLLPLLPGPLPVFETLLAFVLFRIFDVVKPPPCRWLERLQGGVGIMADDVAAGFYAWLCVVLLT